MTDVAIPFGGRIAFNHHYFADLASASYGRVLDYGCGEGQTVALARSRGLDIWGADTFAGFFSHWANSMLPASRDRVRRIEDGRADYPDSHFDLVISNQVLEHVTDPEAVIADMHRMVKPGGMLIAAFPVTETWYEGHVGLYFGHRLRPGRLRRIYFDLCHRLGFGLYRTVFKSHTEWLHYAETFLDESCFYFPRNRLIPAIERMFRNRVEDISADYMRARLGKRVQHMPDSLLRFIYHKRAGEIIRVRKNFS